MRTLWLQRTTVISSFILITPADGWLLFLSQGLSDTEEFVVCKALNALTCLAELGLLQKPTLQELVSEIVPFLCHPVSLLNFIKFLVTNAFVKPSNKCCQ